MICDDTTFDDEEPTDGNSYHHLPSFTRSTLSKAPPISWRNTGMGNTGGLGSSTIEPQPKVEKEALVQWMK